MKRPVHLVGSVLGEGVARVPDGETGVRTNGIQWHRGSLGAHPAIEVIGEGQNAETAMPRFAVRPDFTGDILFADIPELLALHVAI